MRAAITQPNYLPWLGYFALLNDVELWVSLDTVQRSPQSFTVRNRVKTNADKVKWLTVALKRDVPLRTTIRECPLSASDWPTRHLNRIENYYRDATYYRDYFPLLRDLIPPRKDEQYLGRYNRRLVQEPGKLLGVTMETVDASRLCETLTGTAQEKVFHLAMLVGATEVYNFARGVDVGLYSGVAFREHGLRLYRQAYEHPVYRQTGQTFVSYLSVVDLLLNEGTAAQEIIGSGSHWSEVTEEGK
jgi:hypothetical protein